MTTASQCPNIGDAPKTCLSAPNYGSTLSDDGANVASPCLHRAAQRQVNRLRIASETGTRETNDRKIGGRGGKAAARILRDVETTARDPGKPQIGCAAVQQRDIKAVKLRLQCIAIAIGASEPDIALTQIHLHRRQPVSAAFRPDFCWIRGFEINSVCPSC